MMKIAFGEIGSEKKLLRIQENSWLPEDLQGQAEEFLAEFSYRLTNADTARLEGELSGSVQLECARCGNNVHQHVKENFTYLVTTRKEEISDLPEKECSDEECDTLYLDEPVIDLTEILREQIYLAIPGKVLCSSECKGLCPECGSLLNSGECSCSEKLPDTPFAVLKKLKKD